MDETARGRPRAVVALAVFAVAFALACTLLSPRWETNDDVGMAMAAHGFGLAVAPTPALIYSNVLWGHLVQAIPSPGGILGYSVAMLASLFAAGAGLLCGLRRLGAGAPAAVAATVVAVLPAVVAPQFTITAGLLAVAGVVAVLGYARSGGAGLLAAGVALGFLAFLVRPEAALSVAAVATPLLPWRALRRDRAMVVAAVVLVAACALATAVDRRAYAGDEWRAFLALEAPRAEFTDFGVGDRLLAQRPDLLRDAGYSANDVALLGDFFLADRRLADPARLRAVLDAAGDGTAGGLAGGLAAIAALAAPRLAPLLVLALVLGALRPSWRLGAAWAVFVALIFVLGASGRPGADVLRVYVAPLVLLGVAALTAAGPGLARVPVGALQAAALLLALGWQGALTVPAALAAQRQMAAIARDLPGFPAATVVAWGSEFPYRNAYPVLARDPAPRRLRLYALGTDTWAPYSLAAAEEAAGRGLVARLQRGERVPLVASDAELELLRRWCAEHGSGVLQVGNRLAPRRIRVVPVRCAADVAAPARTGAGR